MKHVSIGELINRYHTILFDAFGVLVDGHGRLEGARELIDHLEASQKPYFIVSNGSKFTPEQTAHSYHRRGLHIPAERVITSGGLLKNWIHSEGLVDKPVKVIGPKESLELARWAGAHPVALKDSNYEALVLCNQDGFDFLPVMENLLTELYHKIHQNEEPKLLLLNPDIIYPKKGESLGFTTGSIALLLEHALTPLFPNKKVEFEKLGKPYSPIYKEAITRSKQNKEDLVMIGDQIATDILGAKNMGIDSALTSFGITEVKHLEKDSVPCLPNYILNSLRL